MDPMSIEERVQQYSFHAKKMQTHHTIADKNGWQATACNNIWCFVEQLIKT